MNISDYLRTALLNHSLNVATLTPPSFVWAGLYTVAPTSAGGGTEVTASDYVRVKTSWSPASLGTIQNSADIRFPASGVTLNSWGTLLAMGLFDSLSGGHLLYFGTLSAPVLLGLGNDFKVATNNLAISLS